MQKIKYYLSTAIYILLGLFIVQNISPVDIDFLFWTIELPRSVVLFIVFLMGITAGFLLGRRPWSG